LEVFEVSVVTVPANQNAVVTDVKAICETETKSGRRNSKADEGIIRDAIDQLNSCIKSLETLFGDEDNTEEEEAPQEEAIPEVNEASEEQTENGNSKRASDLLEKINQFKEDSI